jgi:hypothetical protein
VVNIVCAQILHPGELCRHIGEVCL